MKNTIVLLFVALVGPCTAGAESTPTGRFSADFTEVIDGTTRTVSSQGREINVQPLNAVSLIALVEKGAASLVCEGYEPYAKLRLYNNTAQLDDWMEKLILK